ncbi:MAG: sugar phosphate isomerase/epimerase [Phycisphaerales bacterium]|nr:sugar phosphate isomerase/epimerase [Phycisphaerales bacterium]
MAGPRIAVCSWSLAPQDPADLLEQLERLRIDAVQLDLTRLSAEPKIWYPAMELLPSAGVDIISGMMAMEGEDYSSLASIAATGGVRPDATWNVNCTRAEMVAELAETMDVRLTTFHAGFIPESADDGERAVICERLRTIADGFAARGLEIAFETGQETADTLAAALEEIDRTNVGVNFDPANMILYAKGDPVAAVDRLRPWIRQVHVKDAVPTTEPGTWGREVPVGQGVVDWPAFFAAVRTIDPPVDYVIEREAGDDRHADIQAARTLIDAHLGV